MARGGHVDTVPAAPPLPKVSFQKIEDDVSTQPSGVHDGQARSFGCTYFAGRGSLSHKTRLRQRLLRLHKTRPIHTPHR
jgi:NuA3 HAT complex component NTO1